MASTTLPFLSSKWKKKLQTENIYVDRSTFSDVRVPPYIEENETTNIKVRFGQ